MTNPVDTVKNLLSSLKKSTGAVKDSVNQIRGRIGALETEYQELVRKPLTRADYLRLCHATVDHHADRYADQFAGFLAVRVQEQHKVYGTLYTSVNSALALSRGNENYLVGNLISGGKFVHGDANILSEGALYFMFRDQLKGAIDQAFERIAEWPFPDAQPAESYFPRLVEIEAELVTLREQESQLVAEAVTLGIMPAPAAPE